jgi:hypothetical protein
MVTGPVARRPLLVLAAAGLLPACSTPKTGTTAAQPPAPGGTAAARAAFEAALRGYEQDNLKPLEALLLPRFIGRSVLLEGAQASLNEQKQIRITLAEWRVQGDGPEPVSVALTARWDKRFLKLPALTPSAETGTLQAMMRLVAGQWVLESLSPDNPFTR